MRAGCLGREPRTGSRGVIHGGGIDNRKATAYNFGMGSLGQHNLDQQNLRQGLGQRTPADDPDSSRRIIFIAVASVIVTAVVGAFLMRGQPKGASGPPLYAVSLKLSDFKMSAAENFVGATVSYVDGTVANAGDKTVTHAVVEVTFKDEMGQLAQREDIPLQVLKTDGPYPEAVDFGVSPLGPGQSKPFRLTFEGISAQWNRQYPEVQVVDVTVK
jgi:hypothetical protein